MAARTVLLCSCLSGWALMLIICHLSMVAFVVFEHSCVLKQNKVCVQMQDMHTTAVHALSECHLCTFGSGSLCVV